MPAERVRRADAAPAAVAERRGDHSNPLAGSPVPVVVELVLAERAGKPLLFAGRTPDGQRWLVAQISERAGARRWLCAPASDLAIGCVASGRALPADLFRHSATGTVEDITVGPGGQFFESLRLCGSLGDDEVPGR
jgi:hypothetical protein